MNSNGIGIMKKYIEKHYIDKMLNASSTLMSIIKKLHLPILHFVDSKEKNWMFKRRSNEQN